jgi:F420-non-reducing hydrogenase iron-sulfur subunit
MNKSVEPKILAFLCKWCAQASAEMAGLSRLQYPANIRVVLTLCSGRVDPVYVLEGLTSGFDGVFIFGCRFGDCHYLDGNIFTHKRMQVTGQLLAMAGIGPERLQTRWLSSAEGHLFAEYVSELTELIRGLGPLDHEGDKLRLAAAKRTLEALPLRWLMGLERQLTERENVFHEKLDLQSYHLVMHAMLEEEYQKALLFEVLRQGPQTVRQMSAGTGLPVYTVSLRLNDLERRGLAEFHSHEGTSPRFRLLAT